MAEILATTSGTTAARIVFVKWATPAEEAVGIARLASELVRNESVLPERMGIAVPNRNWAAQLQRAALQAGLPTTICMRPARLSAEAQAACAKLAALAEPDDDRARALWDNLGFSREKARQFVVDYGTARAFSLVRVLGMRDIPMLAHAMHHVRGTESAQELYALVCAQLSRPTMPKGVGLVPIVDYRAVSGSYDWLFAVGCVDGLVPGPATFEASTEQERIQALDVDRRAFEALFSAARERVVLSSFAKLDADLARKAHVRAVRFKVEHGKRVAMAAPTLFLNEAGVRRPSTVGGQALLREYNLN